MMGIHRPARLHRDIQALDDAIAAVREQIARIETLSGNGNYAVNYQEFRNRRREAEAFAMEALAENLRARWHEGDPMRVRICGVTACSTQGVTAVLRNWLALAERRQWPERAKS